MCGGPSRRVTCPRRLPGSFSRRTFCGRSAGLRTLHPTAQRVEQRRYGQRGDDDREGGLLAAEDAQGGLQTDHATDVDENEHRGERAVDEGAVYDNVYVVEAVTEHGEADGDRDSRVAH